MKNKLITLASIAVFSISLFILQPQAQGEGDQQTPAVSTEMMYRAVQGWCDGLLKISRTSMEGGDAKAVASEILTTAYAYGDGGTVL